MSPVILDRAPRQRGGRILIVDDEVSNVQLLERTLRKAGYGLLTSTTDSGDALGLYRQVEPDLVLLDLAMPPPDGYALLDQMREAMSPTAYVPILVLTGDRTAEALQRALSAGARDFVTKPFDETELLLRVQNLMETRLLYLGLYHQVEALEYLNSQAQDEARERRQSLSALGHDMAQPLTALIMTIDVMKMELLEGSLAAASVPGELDQIAVLGRQVEAMTRELSDLARIHTGRGLLLSPREMNLTTLARSVAEQMGRTTATHSFRMSAAVSEVVGEWDPVRVHRILSNLLINAVKYSPDGGEIVVAVNPAARDGVPIARMAVRDHGIGIPAADLPYVFEHLYRARNVPTAIRGSGIGLAGVKQIVEQHGGTVAVRSREGRGTTVTVELPLRRTG